MSSYIFFSHSFHSRICHCHILFGLNKQKRKWKRSIIICREKNKKKTKNTDLLLFPARIQTTITIRRRKKHLRPHIGFEFVSVSFLLINKSRTYCSSARAHAHTSFFWSSKAKRKKKQITQKINMNRGQKNSYANKERHITKNDSYNKTFIIIL